MSATTRIEEYSDIEELELKINLAMLALALRVKRIKCPICSRLILAHIKHDELCVLGMFEHAIDLQYKE